MSDEDGELNYAKIAGYLPMPSRLDHITGKHRGPAKFGSKSLGRKAASAMIAKIPLPLSRHIARTYHPGEVALQPTG